MNATDPPPSLSIVVPALNEARRLPKTLKRIHAYVVSRRLRAEVLVIDDGSTDSTATSVEELIRTRKFPELRLISNGQNCGKGFSVRHGMLQARGEIAMFTDADLSAPIEEADKLISAIREGYDCVIGSRRVHRAVIETRQPRVRELAGVIFNSVVRCATGLRFADTQCGFKAFWLERARIIFEQQRTKGFAFDPEILFLARRHGLRVTEIPVRWRHDSLSKVHMLRDSMRMLVDVSAIRWNSLVGYYPITNANLYRDETVRHPV